MRSRSIKPGFYKNEKLAACSRDARLLAPGLWMLADREGRLEDRPIRIKMEIFPADSIDVEQLLSELHTHQHILRYEIDGIKYIQILGFNEHQSPHFTEKASLIPPSIQKDFQKKPPSRKDIPLALPPSSLTPDCSSNEEGVCAKELLLPEWINSQLWKDFMEVRKNKKSAQTSRALTSLINRLDGFRKKGYNPNELIENSIRNSWKDVFEPQEKLYQKSKLQEIRAGAATL